MAWVVYLILFEFTVFAPPLPPTLTLLAVVSSACLSFVEVINVAADSLFILPMAAMDVNLLGG